MEYAGASKVSAGAYVMAADFCSVWCSGFDNKWLALCSAIGSI